MLLSRFWYVVCALALGAAAFLLFLAVTLYNRAGDRAMREALAADSSAVGWYLKDDARNRAAALIPATFSPDIQNGLAKSSGEVKPGRDTKEKVRLALRKISEEVPTDLKFDALWAVDAAGRVIGAVGFEHGEDWELGGYAVVADALHGWIRDDAWVWKGRIYRVVARPVEKEAGGEPVGAIIGAKIVDDAFARAVSKRTDAAVGFYAEGVRVASGAPEGFDKANLDVITQDLKALDDNKDYQEKGRTEARVIAEHLGVVYARLPGEAWELGAGFAVGRLAVSVGGPFDFFSKADNSDKTKVPVIPLVGFILLVAFVGLLLSWFEHTKPLVTFRDEAVRLAKGQIDVLAPSRFRGQYKKIASDINDGIEKVVVKGGGTRRAADLEQVLGPIPAQPAMSAFAVPGAGGVEAPSEPRPQLPKAPVSSRGVASAPRIRASGPGMPAPPASVDTPQSLPAGDLVSEPAPTVPGGGPPRPPPPPRPRPPVPGAAPSAPQAAPAPLAGTLASAGGDADEMSEWQRVYEEFLAVKKQCGEPTASLTFDKFKGTLQRNKDALVARHNCARVKFTVYVKEGKAALKASPVK